MRELATGYGLIEGPVWCERRGLLFSDVLNGGVFALDSDGRVTPVLKHRKGIGGMALHAEGGLVVSGRNVSWKPDDDGDGVPLLETDDQLGTIAFNDLGTDPEGRVYVGSLSFRPVGEAVDEQRPGFLHLIDLDGSARLLARDVMLTNGLGVSPDGRRLYHCDSRASTVWAYDRMADGTVGPRRKFAHVEPGVPDGLAIDVGGAVWVACAHGGEVWQIAPDGVVAHKVPCPLPMPTSVCFGGNGLSTLYVVTGSGGTDRKDAGSVFAMEPGVAGLPVPPARVRLPR